MRRLPERRMLLGFFALLAFVIAGAHGTVLNNELIGDDADLILLHTRLADPDFWLAIPFRDYGLDFGRRSAAGYYRPLFVYFTWVQRQVFGTSATGYRIVSLLSLGLACAVLAAFVWRFSRSSTLAGMTALLFACSPLKTEQVGFVSCWPDLVMSFAPALVLWPILASKRKHLSLPLLWGGAFAATLFVSLVKEAGVIACLAIAVSAFALSRRDWRRGLVTASGVVAACACAITARAAVAGGGPQGVTWFRVLFGPVLPSRAPASLWAAGMTVRRLLVPEPAEYIRYFHKNSAPTLLVATLAELAVCSIAALGAGGLVLLIVRRRPFAAGVLGWFLGMTYQLFVAVGTGLPFFDRYVCVGPASIGLALAVRWACRKIKALRARPRLPALLLALWVAVGVVACLVGSSKLETRDSFWSYVLQHNPHSSIPLAVMASMRFEQGDVHAGGVFAKKAIAADSDEPLTRALGIPLGMQATAEGKPMTALRWYQWSLSRLPTEKAALLGRAIALAQLENYPAARRAALAAQDVLGTDPDLAQVIVRIWIESPDVPVPEAVARVRQEKAIRADIPDSLLNPQVIRAARAYLTALSR